MGRAGKRTRIERGIAVDGTGFSVRVKVGDDSRERRFPPTVDLPYLRAQRAQLEAEIREEQQHRQSIPARRGTFPADVRAYLKRIKSHLQTGTYKSRRSELTAWTDAIGDTPRHALRRADLERIIRGWGDSILPKTLQNRVRTFRHLYRTLDGPHAKTPADGIKLPAVVRTRPRPIERRALRRVVANLIRHERNGRLRDAKTRARFLVLITTGQRPSQMRRTKPGDVQLEQRIWWVPAGKGGNAVPLYLNDDMLAAWKLFVTAKAWGDFDGSSFVKTLRRCGWPADLRVYAARHAVGMDLSEKGVDLGDIQAFLGHRWIQTTRDFYVPMLLSRIKAASESLNDRVGMDPKWARFVGTVKPSKKHKRKAS